MIGNKHISYQKHVTHGLFVYIGQLIDKKKSRGWRETILDQSVSSFPHLISASAQIRERHFAIFTKPLCLQARFAGRKW